MRDNVGDGWCEGFNETGKSGLFPAAYVQMVKSTGPVSSKFNYLVFLNNHIPKRACYS